MSSGKFITLEGGEGVGKSTNAAFIKNHLETQNIPVILTREPGGTAVAEAIRALLLQKQSEKLTIKAELLLMFAAREQHLQQVILPNLERGIWVLCDRFTDATYAYQGGGRKIDNEIIAWLENWIQGTFRPDLTLLLDAPINIGLSRAKARSALDRFESEEILFFEAVRTNYLKRAEANPNQIKVINASQALVDVQKDVITALDQDLL